MSGAVTGLVEASALLESERRYRHLAEEHAKLLGKVQAFEAWLDELVPPVQGGPRLTPAEQRERIRAELEELRAKLAASEQAVVDGYRRNSLPAAAPHGGDAGPGLSMARRVADLLHEIVSEHVSTDGDHYHFDDGSVFIWRPDGWDVEDEASIAAWEGRKSASPLPKGGPVEPVDESGCGWCEGHCRVGTLVCSACTGRVAHADINVCNLCERDVCDGCSRHDDRRGLIVCPECAAKGGTPVPGDPLETSRYAITDGAVDAIVVEPEPAASVHEPRAPGASAPTVVLGAATMHGYPEPGEEGRA